MQSRAAIRYAKAIYEIADEENFIEEIFNDMIRINKLNRDSSDFKNLLSNSIIDNFDKKKAILSLLEKNNPITEKLLDLLIHNKRVAIISDIASSFVQLYNKNNNIKEAIIITASPIDKDLEKKILSQIKIPAAKSITLTNLIDSSIIGGFIIRYDGKEYNASIKQNLKNLKTELIN
jgi:F-type H+-transporting ATPase subunit delta|tara:strand:- start:357 stop:887 length:531 start_codon:yes stop_codon:yes gene_type:complete